MAEEEPQVAKIPEPAASGDGEARRRIPEPARDHQEYEDDFSDQYLSDPSGMNNWIRLLMVLFFVAVTGMAGYMILTILYPDQFASPSWIGATSIKKPAKSGTEPFQRKGFLLGGIRLGMTPAQTRVVYPTARLEPTPNSDGQTGFFVHHEGEYTISFLGPNKGERAFRIRSRHSYAKVSYLELLAELSERYGKPTKANCESGEKVIVIQCTLNWKMMDVELDALIRTEAPEGPGEAQTMLRVTATDIRPPSAFIRPAVEAGGKLGDQPAAPPRPSIGLPYVNPEK
ncbi:MAG: hypothetical protein IIC56_01670 [Proteobacteria bacterium]|nr:hypothetical protein [Pseudomonadota bacterium]